MSHPLGLNPRLGVDTIGTDRQFDRLRRQERGRLPAGPDGGAEKLAPTIYHERWWLDAASDGAWDEAVVEQGGSIVGRLPYLRLTKTRWHGALVMPPMTHTLGPAVVSSGASSPAGAALGLPRQTATIASLIGQLPRASHVWFRMHAGISTTLAFEAAGFRSGVDYTVCIEPGEADALWRGMRDKTRNVIRRAEETHTVESWPDPAAFLEFYAQNVRSRGLRNAYEIEDCVRVIAACLARGRGEILVARDGASEPQAAVFIMWDRAQSYYHMSTRRPGSGNGVISLLIWRGIRDAAAAGRTFDMDGIEGDNLLLASGFGGRVRSRLLAWREDRWYGAARSLRTALGRRALRP